MVRNQGDAIGVLVGAPKPYVLPHQIQHEVADLCSVPYDDVKDGATSFQSIWKPSHGYNGLLYRVNESAIVISSHVGEVFVVLTKIFRVSVADQSMYFVC